MSSCYNVCQEGDFLEAIDIARLAVDAAGEKQAADIVLLDLRKLAALADYFVICSAESDKQIRTVAEEIEQRIKKAGAKLLHDEGNAASGWILLDYGDVIVHIFAPEEREFYQLEQLWGRADLILRIQ